MRKFKTIQEWLSTNPDKEEQNKVLLLIQKGSTSKIRREYYEKNRYFLKLKALENHFKRLNLEFPKSEVIIIEKVKKELEELKSQLPSIPVKDKKYKEPETKTEVLADASEK
jgi:DNA polymerase III alpha subunit